MVNNLILGFPKFHNFSDIFGTLQQIKMDLEPGSIDDKSARSVFVGNIPYEVTEERLKDIFSAVGPVLSFKLVFDRENGKPRGYGFCEFSDTHLVIATSYFRKKIKALL